MGRDGCYSNCKHTNLRIAQGVNGRPTRKDHQGETGGHWDHKAELDEFTKEGGPKVHEHVARDVFVAEGHVAKETHLVGRGFKGQPLVRGSIGRPST